MSLCRNAMTKLALFLYCVNSLFANIDKNIKTGVKSPIKNARYVIFLLKNYWTGTDGRYIS